MKRVGCPMVKKTWGVMADNGCTMTKIWVVIVELVYYFSAFVWVANSIMSLHVLCSIQQWWCKSPYLLFLLHAPIAASDHCDLHETKRHWCTLQTMHPCFKAAISKHHVLHDHWLQASSNPIAAIHDPEILN